MVDSTKRTDERSSPLVQARRLGVELAQNRVLRDISLQINRGETVAILGESGCGKTVLLKTLIRLIRPTRGSVLFDGKNLDKLSGRELARQRIRFGFVFQQAALFDSMTIGQNVAFPLRQHTRRSETQIYQTVVQRLAEVGLSENVMERKPAELSGGMRKRVGLARALVLDPEVVLYDEPTTGLDPIMADVINELILAARDRHSVTGIVVTHDMRTARKVADRVVMLYPLGRLDEDEPQILYDGPPEEIEASPDPRVAQFVRGEAGERLMEMRKLHGGRER